MIDKIAYTDMLTISQELDLAAKTVKEIIDKYNVHELDDFVSTVEGYSKFLGTTVELYQDADKALENLANNK